jgi:5-methylcytosine-specific restriction endonuclease McrA
MGLVWVQIEDGNITRIFRNRKAAIASEGVVEKHEKADAVSQIRNRVFELAEGFCKYCNKYVPFCMGHMHEEKHRGEGGEVSIYNSVWSCWECHRKEHPEKTLRFGEHA